MRLQVVVVVLAISWAPFSYGSSLLSAPSGAPAVAEGADLTSDFSVNAPTLIPGTTLKPGAYVIRLVDHLTDRTVLRVETKDGKVLATFLGLPNRSLDRNRSTGPVLWATSANHNMAVRGFAFPGGETVEFVYPKAQAVQLAVANSQSVEAIDPASDDLPTKQKSLSHDDMQIVTLWTLSPTAVNGPTEKPGISASRYHAPAAPVLEANNTPPPNPAAATRESSAPTAGPRQTPVARPTGTAKSMPSRRPVAAKLPQTASSLPIAWISAALSLLGLGALRLRRTVANV